MPVIVTEKSYEIQVSEEKITHFDRRVTKDVGRAFEQYHSFRLQPKLTEGTREITIILEKILAGYPYSQADVIHRMKEERIGRPSTHATIMEKLFQRRYTIERKHLLFSTKLGRTIHDHLVQRYEPYISVNRTRGLQEQLDKIESGTMNINEVLMDLYQEITEIT